MRRGAILALLAALAGSCRSTAHEPPEEAPSIRRTLSVGFVVGDGVHGAELALALDVCDRAGSLVFTVARSLDPVRTSAGLRLLPDHAFGEAPAIDVLVVPGAKHAEEADGTDRIDFVRERGSKARQVVSLGDGAFVLARAGLLEGRSCTTIPADADRLRKAFPRLRVEQGPSFVHDGIAITSVGGARSGEAALYLTELLHGADAAREVARGLGIDWNLASVPHAIR